MSEPLIYKIQKFSIHDGPGLRTTVFFKGCPLRCQWCHNPESQSFQHDFIGIHWPIPKLLAELEKDRIFYDESGGGVTLSGGEPLAQDIGYIASLASALKNQGISVIIDTCGDVPFENFSAILSYADMFLYDLKLLDNNLHMSLTGVSNDRVLENLMLLSHEKAKICLRLPLLAGINDSLHDMEMLSAWLNNNDVRPIHINLLPYHLYGRNKYDSLDIDVPQAFNTPSQAQLEAIKAFWESQGYLTGIGGYLH